jgi:hypothetical protein
MVNLNRNIYLRVKQTPFMISSTNFICNNTENLCFERALNLSNISYNDIPPRSPYFLRLSQNSSSYWTTITILFFFISFNIMIYILRTLLYFDYSNKNYIEIIDFTNEDEYRSIANQEFQLRYGQRSSIHREKPYHLYKHFLDQSIK